MALKIIERATKKEWAPRRSPKMNQLIEDLYRIYTIEFEKKKKQEEEEDFLDEIELNRLQSLAEHPELENFWIAHASKKKKYNDKDFE